MCGISRKMNENEFEMELFDELNIFEASREGNIERIKYLIANEGIDVNLIDRNNVNIKLNFIY